MKLARFVFLFLFSSTSLFSQSNRDSLPDQQVANTPAVAESKPDLKSQAKIIDSYGKLPLSFEANQGQTDARVKFLSRTSGYALFLTDDEAVMVLSRKTSSKPKVAGIRQKLESDKTTPKAIGVLRMKLRNANLAAKVTGVDALVGTTNYFIGNDPAKWRTNVSNMQG
jgi:hypothetical protein